MITGFIFLVSCATQLRHIDDEYKHIDFSDSRLAIVLPNTNEFIINNPDDVSDDLDTAGTGNVQGVFSDFFQYHVLSALKNYSCFNKIQWIKRSDSLPTDHKTYILGRNKDISFDLPSKDYRFAVDPSCRFVLVLNPVEISRYRGSEGNYIQDFDKEDIYKTADPQQFRLYTEYVFWDNDESRAAAFGIINIQRGILINLTRKDWINLIHQMCWEIIRYTPFKKAEIDFY